jgi:uncharacterized repeat protein (TIGR01451 family)
VSINTTTCNDPPVAVNDAATTLQNNPISVAVLANDFDVNGDPLTITAVSVPSHGSAVINGTNIDYTPNNNYVGPDSFTYTISDGRGGSAMATVSITVNPIPVIDLSIVKSHTGSFTVGINGVYSLAVINIGNTATTGAITVTDTLPTGLSFVSGTGAGWTCSAAAQAVTCTNLGPIAAGANSTITLTVGVGAAAVPSVTNTASVSTSGDANPGNNSSSDPTTVNPPPPRPTLTSIQPAAGGRGTVVNVTITGANFIAGSTTVNVSGTGITVGPVTGGSSSSLTTSFTIASNAPFGARNVKVTTPGGTTADALAFTVRGRDK